MDNERKDMPENQDWLDDVLGKASPEKELGADEHAVYAAGLIHPNDMELEMILAEHREESLEAAIGRDVEAVMADPVPTRPESTLQLDEEVQSAISDEVTRFFEVPAEAPPADPFFHSMDPITGDSSSGQAPEDLYFQPMESVEATNVLPQEVYAAPYPAEAAEAPYDASQEPEEAGLYDQPEEEEPVRKGRPKWKKGYGLLGIPHILATGVWLLIIVLAGISLGRTLWLCCADLMAFDKPEAEAVIVIEDNDTIETVAQKLAEEGLIRYPGLFKQFAELTGKSDRISQGSFTLHSRLDYNAMINGMSAHAKDREEVDIMFPEGYTCAQIFQLLEENNVCTVAELEEYAANGELDYYWFLEDVQRGDKYCLEGYMFPDTYTFYTNDEPRRVIEKFLDCFDVRFTDIMRERLTAIGESYARWLEEEGYGQEYIEAHPITVREAVIIASLIEKESSGGDENYMISSVIYNRLVDTSQPPYLNIDAALIYGMGGKFDPVTGEAIPLTSEDLQLDNPYNTYLYTGLTPGPICNPGQECLNAALLPDDTDYYYYALDPESGVHKFFKTYKEHQKFLDSLD